MKKIILFFIATFVIILNTSISLARGETVITEHDLKERLLANRILHLYLTDEGITGVESDQFGERSSEFIVLGPYDKLPDEISAIAKAHNVQILPSQKSPKMTQFEFWRAILYRSLFFLMPVLIFIWLILINKRLNAILALLKK